MSLLNAPKAIYKAQQAKKQMSKIQAAGMADGVSILLNGLNDVVEIEIEETYVSDLLSQHGQNAAKVKDALQKSIKNAFADAKKQLEKELVSSTSLEDLKELLG